MFDIIRMINEGVRWNVSDYARVLYKPYSIIEQEYNRLVYEEYLKEGQLTSKAIDYLDSHRVKNAIILAAGISARFVPLCYETPKALLKVKGEVMIERQIRQIKEAGIEEIVVVVGHMREKFYYLREKYGVKIVETDTYKVRNNHASVYAAKEYLGQTIVTSSDLYFNKNIFQGYAYDSFYCTVYKEGETDERGVDTDKYDRIIRTYYKARDCWVTLGYAYFNTRFCNNFLEILEREYNKPESLPKFWADFQDENLDELFMYAKRVDNDVIYEFDSLEELREFDKGYFTSAKSALLTDIANYLGVEESELKQFKPITKEDLGRGFTFLCQQKRYICKISKRLKIESIKRFDDSIQELVNLTESFSTYYDMTLPLCAAENVISPFVKMPLSMGFQERYIVGNTYSYEAGDNFIGSTYLLPFYEMISKKCNEIFHAKYTDARTLTGMNCLMMVLTSLSSAGEKILILGAHAGGHSSVKPIAERLGLKVGEVPFDYSIHDIDYDALNETIEKEIVDFILLAPSDIIHPLDVAKINTKKTVLLYDVSQIMGLIGAGLVENPLDVMENCVLFGGTHKTFPGPACGLIMTNSNDLHDRLERTINPIYIRHTQMHQKVSLLFSLIEFEIFGEDYERHIVELSNELGKQLDDLGFDVGRISENEYSRTHELFIYLEKDVMERVYNNSKRLGITLNKKQKKLFKGYGIRLGTQEIARYGWPKESMKDVAGIIYEISKPVEDGERINKLFGNLPAKKIQYTFDHSVRARFDGIVSRMMYF